MHGSVVLKICSVAKRIYNSPIKWQNIIWKIMNYHFSKQLLTNQYKLHCKWCQLAALKTQQSEILFRFTEKGKIVLLLYFVQDGFWGYQLLDFDTDYLCEWISLHSRIVIQFRTRKILYFNYEIVLKRGKGLKRKYCGNWTLLDIYKS